MKGVSSSAVFYVAETKRIAGLHALSWQATQIADTVHCFVSLVHLHAVLSHIIPILNMSTMIRPDTNEFSGSNRDVA
jgi:hypothetical protein